jgi:Protein of unknown function (DUF2914)
MMLRLILMVLLFAVPAHVEAGEASLKIVEMAVTTKVVKGKPIDAVHRISSQAVKALYCFTRVTAVPGTESTIKHVWYRNDTQVAEFELPVKGERWRTYSKRPVTRGDAGEWRVEAVDSGGRVLKTIKFQMH